jgi:hypothetical protein
MAGKFAILKTKNGKEESDEKIDLLFSGRGVDPIANGGRQFLCLGRGRRVLQRQGLQQ